MNTFSIHSHTFKSANVYKTEMHVFVGHNLLSNYKTLTVCMPNIFLLQFILKNKMYFIISFCFLGMIMNWFHV